jgi:hypothetical protein
MGNKQRKGPSKEERAKAMQDLVDAADRAKAPAPGVAPPADAEQPKAPSPEEVCAREVAEVLRKHGMGLSLASYVLRVAKPQVTE